MIATVWAWLLKLKAQFLKLIGRGKDMPDFGFKVVHSSGVETGLTPQRLFYLATVKTTVNVSKSEGTIVWQSSYSFDTNKYNLALFVSMPGTFLTDMSGYVRSVISGNSARIETNGNWQNMAQMNISMIVLVGLVEK